MNSTMNSWRKQKKLVFAVTLVGLVSCANRPAIPPEYTGPVATIQETAVRVDQGKAQMFYLSKIDGVYMRDNSASRSFLRSSGKGNNLTIVDSPYDVPAQQHVFTIQGGHVWAMDGRGILEADLTVTGDIEFEPKEGNTYLINGSLSEEESVVWIKEQSTGEIIAEFRKQDP
ncbi:MAG: hypothetical protein AAF417_09835 [Pseudomonadota bacterium]